MLTPLFEVTPRPEERLISLTYGDVKQRNIIAYMVGEVSTDGKSIAKISKRNMAKAMTGIPLGTLKDGQILWMSGGTAKNGQIAASLTAVGA